MGLKCDVVVADVLDGRLGLGKHSRRSGHWPKQVADEVRGNAIGQSQCVGPGLT